MSEIVMEAAISAAMLAQYKSEMGRDEWVPFDEMPEDFLERYRANATLILESAAPHLLAEAWEEGMLSQFEADLLGKTVPPNPHE